MAARGGRRRRRSLVSTLLPVLVVLVVLAVVAGAVWGVSRLVGGGSDETADDPPTSQPTDPPGDGSTEETSEPPSTPQAPEPAVGDCRDLAWDDTGSDVTDAGAEPVACTADHTAQTFVTGTLDTETGLDPAADPGRLVEAVAVRCRQGLVDWLGSDEAGYELSMYAYVVAIPSAEDVAAGADWWRCDTYVTARDGVLATLPKTTESTLDSDTDGVGQWATCVDGDLGPDQVQVLCRQKHDWRAVSAFRLGERDAAFPGVQTVVEQARTTCEDEVRAYVGDPLEGFDYGWLRPTAADWTAGQRFALCFSQTTD